MNMKGGISVALDRDADDDCVASKNLKKIQKDDPTMSEQYSNQPKSDRLEQ